MGVEKASQTETSSWKGGEGMDWINIPPNTHCKRNNTYFDLCMHFYCTVLHGWFYTLQEGNNSLVVSAIFFLGNPLLLFKKNAR